MSVFLVTGASRGLGRSIVTAALAAGHQVVAGVRDVHALDDLIAGSEPTSASAQLVPVVLDVTDPDAARAAVRTAVGRFGRLDVLVNNAGYANLASIEDVDPADFRAQVETNLFGVVTLSQEAVHVMREQGSGHIVQVSSVGGRMSTPGLGAYQTAKWAVGGFSSVLAKEVGPLGIRVTVLEPGGMRTDWAGSSMSVAPVRPEYEATVGVSARMHGARASVRVTRTWSPSSSCRSSRWTSRRSACSSARTRSSTGRPPVARSWPRTSGTRRSAGRRRRPTRHPSSWTRWRTPES